MTSRSGSILAFVGKALLAPALFLLVLLLLEHRMRWDFAGIVLPFSVAAVGFDTWWRTRRRKPPAGNVG